MRIRILFYLAWISTCAFSQTGIEQYLESVEKNNKEILAAQRFAEAEKLSHRTGLNPENPFIEYGYMPGSNGATGTKQIYSVSQAFHFPSVYFTRINLAKNQNKKTELEYQQYRQEVLLDAKLLFYEYVYLKKLEEEYLKRAVNGDKLYNSFQAKFEQGQASILDVNKVRMQNLHMQQDVKLLSQKVITIEEQLVQYNGGNTFRIADTNYAERNLPALDSLKNEMMVSVPELQVIKSEQELNAISLNLQKQAWIPQFELGYEAKREPDGTYGGIKAGISIPLWQDKNAVRLARAKALYTDIYIDSRKVSIMAETERKYKEAQNYYEMLEEFKDSMGEVMQTSFLDKALQHGQISVIEYINELAFYYEMVDHYLESEREYYLILAKLYQHRL